MKTKPASVLVRPPAWAGGRTRGGVEKKYQRTRLCLTLTRSTKGSISSSHAMATRGTTASAARNAVFNTQELLEEILVNLPTKDLFAIQGVCSHWRTTARTTPKLMREKFLQIVKNHTLLWFDRAKDVVKKQSATDLARFGKCWLSRQTAIHSSKLNTMLFTHIPDAERQPLFDRCVMCETLVLLAQPDLASAWNINNTANRMFVANPPPVNVELEIAFAPVSAKSGRKAQYASGYTIAAERHTVENQRGVTWSDVVQELDLVLFCANRRRPPGTRELVIDAGKCKVWMRGIVFPTETEWKILSADGSLGMTGAVNGVGG